MKKILDSWVGSYTDNNVLAQELMRRASDGEMVHDTRVYWNTREVLLATGGQPVRGKTDHAFIKECMRAEDAVYDAEMSAHHYFRDLVYCDSGMLPELLVATQMHRTGHPLPLADLVAMRMGTYPCLGEINCRVQLGREQYAPPMPSTRTAWMARIWNLQTGASTCACPILNLCSASI